MENKNDFIGIKKTIRTCIAEIEGKIKKRKLSRIKTGIRQLDRLTGGLHKKSIVYLKTPDDELNAILAANIYKNLIENVKIKNKNCLYLDLKKNGTTQFTEKLIQLYSKVKKSHISSGAVSINGFARLLKAVGQIKDFEIWFKSLTEKTLIEELVSSCSVNQSNPYTLVFINGFELENITNKDFIQLKECISATNSVFILLGVNEKQVQSQESEKLYSHLRTEIISDFYGFTGIITKKNPLISSSQYLFQLSINLNQNLFQTKFPIKINVENAQINSKNKKRDKNENSAALKETVFQLTRITYRNPLNDANEVFFDTIGYFKSCLEAEKILKKMNRQNKIFYKTSDNDETEENSEHFLCYQVHEYPLRKIHPHPKRIFTYLEDLTSCGGLSMFEEEPFFGKKLEDNLFQVGEIVRYLSGNELRIGIISGIPHSIEEIEKKNKKYKNESQASALKLKEKGGSIYDQSDNSYCILYGENGHSHVMEYDIFKLKGEILPDLKEKLIKRMK